MQHAIYSTYACTMHIGTEINAVHSRDKAGIEHARNKCMYFGTEKTAYWLWPSKGGIASIESLMHPLPHPHSLTSNYIPIESYGRHYKERWSDYLSAANFLTWREFMTCATCVVATPLPPPLHTARSYQLRSRNWWTQSLYLGAGQSHLVYIS